MSKFDVIPIIDYSNFADPSSKEQELEKLKEAIFEIGFLYLINTGIESSVDDIYALLPDLFALSDKEKEKCSMRNSPSFLGYTKLGAESTAKATDMREQFDFGTVPKKQWVEGDPIYKKLEGNSQIPALPGLPSKLETYTRNMTHLSHTFLSLVGECLSLPPTTFHRFLGGMDRFKLVKYPAISPTAGASSSFGVGPHKDSTGLFTFLSQDSIGGLQVLLKSGKWVDAPPIPSSFVVNIQQGFEAITGGLCSATTHRVLAPKHKTRYSLPFFLGVDLDITLEDLKSSAKDIIARVPVVDNNLKKEVDVPSEFMSDEFHRFGEAQLRNRIVSHKDVGKKWYPELYDKYVTGG